MGQAVRAPWAFSPLEVVAESLAFVAFNLAAMARWAFAPLVYGIGFRFFMPALPEAGGGAPAFLPVLLLLSVILLWIRVPLEVRIYRKSLLGEMPGQFYGQELLSRRTLAYLWAYIRVIALFVAVLGPGLILVTMLAAPLIKGGSAGPASEATSLALTLGMFALLGLLYALLAPRVILVFPSVALGGTGALFGSGPLIEIGKKARWRMVAVMAVIWAPEHALNTLAYLGGNWEWWKGLAETWWFTLASYLLGFATLVVSSAAGGFMFRRLRAGLAATHDWPGPAEADEQA